MLSEHGDHLMYDLAQDPEEELNIFGAPKGDIFNQYGHYADVSDVTSKLISKLRASASLVGDGFGVRLADNCDRI